MAPEYNDNGPVNDRLVRKMFRIYDSKAQLWNDPFFFRTVGEAIRAFLMSAQQNPVLREHPDDYTLFEVGEDDQVSGNVTMHEAKVSYGTALELTQTIKE